MTAPSSLSAQVLSAFTEEDSAFLKSLALEPMRSTEDVRGFLTTPAAGSDATSETRLVVEFPHHATESKLEHALQIAALLGAFDPIRLISDVDEQDLKILLKECTVSTDGISSRWSLRAATRERLLTKMASDAGALARGVEGAKGYLERSGESVDDVTQTLIGIASGKPPRQTDFAAMSKETLAANRAVIGWLRSIDRKMGFDASRLLRSIELAELLEPFRFLTGFDPNTGGDTFVGRQDELRQLRAFVDALRSEGLLESVQRSGRRWIGSDRRVLGFSGVGGVGKSTLLSKFILQHVDSNGDSPLRFAYLDFDRSTISAAQPVTLLLELARQVGWQIPEAQQGLEGLRSRIREEMERNRAAGEGNQSARGPRQIGTSTFVELTEPSEPELPEELIGPSLLNSYLYEAGQILSRDQAGNPPLLLVLDTFEEAQVLGDQAVRRVEAFVEALQGQLHNVRAVIVGRDAIGGFFDRAERLVVSEFKDSASRIAFLEKRGLGRNLAKTVAKQVGGRPLALLLAARLVKEQGLDSISVSLADRFRGLFNKYLIDGILYERILQHIDDDDVKALAHPGLVLRRIDADVLRQVVAPVLGLGEISAERAAKILSALKLQKDLVRSEVDGSVTHRPDVREQMLVLMGLEKPDLVRALHIAAAKYYAARQVNSVEVEERERFRIEEIYHRLSIGDSLDRMPELWFARARLGLARSVDELEDVSGRGTLKVLLGRIPTDEELGALPDSVLRQYTTRALGAAIQLPDPDRALAILAESPQNVDSILRRSIEPRALDLSGQWTSARRLFVKSVEEQGIELPIVDALAAADFFERIPGRERHRDVMHVLVMDLYGLQLQSNKNRRWLLPLRLSALRLEVRDGIYGNYRPSVKEIEFDGGWSEIAVSEALDTDQQWTMTLTNEIERKGPRLIESMRVTDTIRGQLAYLKSLLIDEANHSEDAAICVKICDALAQASTIGMLAQKEFSEPSERNVVSRILRHLVRPQTPQWYVPIACLIRRELGESVRSEDLYDGLLPGLPFRAASIFRTIRALADYLGRLDQLGVLHTCLQHRFARLSESGDTEAGVTVGAFLEWRNVMLFDVDAWFESFERIKRLSNSSTKAN
jgi:hypothetical protein